MRIWEKVYYKKKLTVERVDDIKTHITMLMLIYRFIFYLFLFYNDLIFMYT